MRVVCDKTCYEADYLSIVNFGEIANAFDEAYKKKPFG
jgi:hypothetical protein